MTRWLFDHNSVYKTSHKQEHCFLHGLECWSKTHLSWMLVSPATRAPGLLAEPFWAFCSPGSLESNFSHVTPQMPVMQILARFWQWWGECAPECPWAAQCSHSPDWNAMELIRATSCCTGRSEASHPGSGSLVPRGTTDLFLAVHFLMLLSFWVQKSWKNFSYEWFCITW